MTSPGADTYFLERVTLEDSDEDDFNYEDVEVDSELEDDKTEDDFEALTKAARLHDKAETVGDDIKRKVGPDVVKRPEVVDDFIRNFLNKMGMTRTLDVFQTEWYELQQKGKLREEDVSVVPDVYLRNQQLDDTIKALYAELDAARAIAAQAKGTWDKFRKERDYHRMHHKRVVQEKNKLIVDIKRLRQHNAMHEPAMQGLQKRYELAMKEKAMARLERDKMLKKMEQLEATIAGMRESEGRQDKVVPKKKKGPVDSVLPSDERTNPFLNAEFETTEVSKWTNTRTFKAHLAPISGIAVHPKKDIIATASDDSTWKVWSVPNGDLLMSGDGHKEWVSGIDFHPTAARLATTSGDSTVKFWDLSQAKCTHTFTEHSQAVWNCAFHDLGDFLVSCSMDHTAKLWDLHTLKCRQTLRGHVDSVNHVSFQPFSNNVCTCSGDKTISLWDARTGFCIQVLYGHLNSCNHAAFNMQGDTIASTDADGIVKLWDVRMVSERADANIGPHAANKATFDISGRTLVVASDDASLRTLDTLSMSVTGELRGHEDCALAVALDTSQKYLVSAGADQTFRIWQ